MEGGTRNSLQMQKYVCVRHKCAKGGRGGRVVCGGLHKIKPGSNVAHNVCKFSEEANLNLELI